MASLFNAVSINQGRYYFATQLDGEQQLTIDYPVMSGISTTMVGITGTQGNEVQINQMPVIIATEFMEADEGLAVGGASTYWTPSTINATYAGLSLSTDRAAGSGIACIESYGTNGPFGGFEFLSRGVNSELVSTTNAGINTYISSVGRPGATAVLGASGTMLTNNFQGAIFSAIDVATTGGGRTALSIQDLSGATALPRWGVGTSGVPGGSNSGSDYTIYSYGDAGNFIDSPFVIRRSDGAVEVKNISSIQTTLGGTARGQVFPIVTDNTEFGLRLGQQITPVLQVLFSTPVANLNPNTQSLVNINWANSLSTGSNLVNYKVGFSTSTAYTNIIQTSYVPGLGGSWTPSDVPSGTTPVGHTNICAVLDSDGLDATGSGFLYVAGQLSDPSAANDQIWITKGSVTEATRNALTYKCI